VHGLVNACPWISEYLLWGANEAVEMEIAGLVYERLWELVHERWTSTHQRSGSVGSILFSNGGLDRSVTLLHKVGRFIP
jgi:hypothetical protein